MESAKKVRRSLLSANTAIIKIPDFCFHTLLTSF